MSGVGVCVCARARLCCACVLCYACVRACWRVVLLESESVSMRSLKSSVMFLGMLSAWRSSVRQAQARAALEKKKIFCRISICSSWFIKSGEPLPRVIREEGGRVTGLLRSITDKRVGGG